MSVPLINLQEALYKVGIIIIIQSICVELCLDVYHYLCSLLIY